MRWKRRGRGRVNLPALASCDFAAVSFLLTPLLSSKKPLLWGDILWRSRLLAVRFSPFQFWLAELFGLEVNRRVSLGAAEN
eukprot:5200927-Pyramimonas_sp.AAC.1